MFYWFLKWVAIGPLLRVVFRPQVEGAEHVPEDGPAILASNHLSYADWLFMPLTLSRRVTFVAKAEYFTGTGLKGWLQKTFFSGSGQVPIDRSGADAAAGALLAAGAPLAAGAAGASLAFAASSTSCLRIRPPTPVPATEARSTPCWFASLRTSGVT